MKPDGLKNLFRKRFEFWKSENMMRKTVQRESVMLTIQSSLRRRSKTRLVLKKNRSEVLKTKIYKRINTVWRRSFKFTNHTLSEVRQSSELVLRRLLFKERIQDEAVL